jgi:hypothetical protein
LTKYGYPQVVVVVVEIDNIVTGTIMVEELDG